MNCRGKVLDFAASNKLGQLGLSFWRHLSDCACDLLFLEQCRICHLRSPSSYEQSRNKCKSRSLCQQCWEKLQRSLSPRLDWCEFGTAEALHVGSGTCYAGYVKKLLYHLKYDGDRLIARDLACFLVAGWGKIAAHIAGQPVIFVPVPLHRDRQATRGYNQTELIACHAARELDLSVDAKALSRVKPTLAQHGLGRQARVDNLRGAFACAPIRVEGKVVVLVDDVFTSGATLSEAARTITAGGARGVLALTVARAEISVSYK